ncbi:hypothetical protein [Flavihumibacter sp. CACIAM 22H1]|uniref:hypothetical protein n=1 Tax=Flavihumibacter sp. CACIAM 22H1 TaxID=1812911 RepID=UPI0007A802CA|nr:hypothetical protein [Flavihumibacter sp. CACIAM 22H1]KYP16457.1 MAG: hypothetical protein A1D16_13285 [Flavihumibacter sp. CACIAM 22H1]
MRRFVLIFLLASSSSQLIAQTTATDGFGLPERFVFRRSFTIQLPNKNEVGVEMADINDMDRLMNLDSILQKVYADIQQVIDTLPDPLRTTKLQHACYEDGLPKIQLNQYAPRGQQFILINGSAALLKTEQDTLIVTGVIKNPAKPAEFKVNNEFPRYYRLTVLLNRITDLPELLNGELNSKMNTFSTAHTTKWTGGKKDSFYALAADPTIVAKVKRAYTGYPNDQLELKASVLLQNYKQYFTPAFNLEGSLVLTNKTRSLQHSFTIAWQPSFLFSKNEEGKLQAFRNDFIELSYESWSVANRLANTEGKLRWNLSLGYLARRRGDFYAPSTFRFGMGQVRLKKTRLEPGFYFNNFFRGISPTIRLTQSF